MIARTPLKYLVKINPVKSETSLQPTDQVSFVPMDAISENGGLRADEERELEDVYTGYTYFKEGDIVLAKITPCFENGKAAIATGLTNETGFGTTELHVLRPEKITREYLFYLICSDRFRKVGESMMYGAGGQKRLPEKFVANYEVSITDVPTQKAIARYLDERTARIDALIAKKQRLLTLLAERRAALITRAVTRGLDERVKLKDSGVEWLGKIPVGWEVKRLRHLASVIGGGTPNTGNPDYWKGTIPWVSPKDMKAKVISETQDYITEEGLGNSPCSLICVGTLLMVVRSGILRHSIPVAINSVPVALNQDMKGFIVNCLVQSQYLFYLFHGLQYQLLPLLTKPGSTVESIEMQYLLDLELPVPPLAAQKKVCQHLETQLNSYNFTETKVEHSLHHLQEYRSALITAAVNGQVELPVA